VRYLKDPLRYEQSLISVRGLLWEMRAVEIYRAVHGKEALKRARVRGQRVGQLLDLDSDPRAVAHCALIDGYLHDLNIAENYWGFRLDAETKTHTLTPTCEHCGSEDNCLCELELDAPEYDEAEYAHYIADGGPIEVAASKWKAAAAAIQHALGHQHKLVNGVDMPRGWKADQYKTSYWRSKEWLEELPHTGWCVSVDNRAIVWPNSEATDVAKEEPMEHSILDDIRAYKSDIDLYQGYTGKDGVKELKAFCKALGLKNYSGWNKDRLVRELATLAGLELQMFAGAEEVTPDEAREATIQAEKPVVTDEQIAHAVEQIKIWRVRPRSPKRDLILKGWVLRHQILVGVQKGRDMAPQVAQYRAVKEEYRALGDEPKAAPAPKAKNLTLGEHLAQSLEAKGIPYEWDGDILRWKGGIVTLANHVLGFTRTFIAWCTPNKWVGCVASEVVKVRK